MGSWADHMGVHIHGRTSETGSQRILREKGWKEWLGSTVFPGAKESVSTK